MPIKFLKHCGILIAMSASLSSPSTADVLSAESNQPGGGSYLAMVGLSTVVAKNTNHTIEVNAGIPVSKSMVKSAKGGLDLTGLVLALVPLMQQGKGPYAKLENSSELAGNLRSILAHPSGMFHVVTFEKSGIRTLADLKGKKVYTGPARSAMRSTGTSLIKSDTGYEAGVDYEILDLDLQGGQQAFLDGHVDVWVRPAPLGGAMIEQVGVSRNIRILGMSEEGINSEIAKMYQKDPGASIDVIPANTYSGQINDGPVKTMGFWLGMGVNAQADEQTIYEITNAVINNLETFKSTGGVLFDQLSRDTLLSYLNIPLHPGAYRAYQEAGISVPEALIPPEVNN